jgi:hypothetical protein
MPNVVMILAVVAGSAACAPQKSDGSPVVWALPETSVQRQAALQAATVLRDSLVANKVYPTFDNRCLGFELEAADNGTFDFAARFNQRLCGGDSPSNLLDRYRVVSANRVILRYDPSDGTYSAGECLNRKRQ